MTATHGDQDHEPEDARAFRARHRLAYYRRPSNPDPRAPLDAKRIVPCESLCASVSEPPQSFRTEGLSSSLRLMAKKLTVLMASIMTLGAAASFNGCSCHAETGGGYYAPPPQRPSYQSEPPPAPPPQQEAMPPSPGVDTFGWRIPPLGRSHVHWVHGRYERARRCALEPRSLGSAWALARVDRRSLELIRFREHSSS